MSKRSNWSDVDKETRKYVLKRDKKCILCNNKKTLTMAHIFLSRAKGGKGCKENIVALCANCHYYKIDNPLGQKNNEEAKKYIEYCKKYLIEKENINYNKEFIESLKYKKEIKPIEFDTKIDIKKCKTCKYCSKNKYPNNTIGAYYCKIKRKAVGKNNNICEFYE